MSLLSRISGRSAFLQLLVDEGVTHLFGNPGTTELPLMEVVPDFRQLKFVLGRQESVVLDMADGYGRASHRLAGDPRGGSAAFDPAGLHIGNTRVTFRHERGACYRVP